MTWMEAIATFFGLLCVWLTIRQNVFCWPAGLVQVLLFIFIFYDAKLYADVVLHVIYVVLSIYGWIHWSKPDRSQLAVTVVRHLPLWMVVVIAGTGVWGYALTRFTDASVPYFDSFVVMASLVAQWLMARKKLESWYFWIMADIVAIGVYGYKALYMTTALYFVFLILAVTGYVAWRKDLRMRKQTAHSIIAQ
jgi:nicotinamide mononucleotide transporter